MHGPIYRRPLPSRNGNAATCQTCGEQIAPKRGSRRQRFCSLRCKRRSYSDQKRVSATPPADRGRSVENTFAFSNGCKAKNAGRAFPLNLLGGYRWPDALPVDAKTFRKIVRAEIGGETWVPTMEAAP